MSAHDYQPKHRANVVVDSHGGAGWACPACLAGDPLPYQPKHRADVEAVS